MLQLSAVSSELGREGGGQINIHEWRSRPCQIEGLHIVVTVYLLFKLAEGRYQWLHCCSWCC